MNNSILKEVALPNLVLLGIQGSGKGTQANLLSKNYGFIHLNVGSLLRKEMEDRTETGENIKGFMKRGDLVPDQYIFSIIGPVLTKEADKLVLDGFPRTLKQAHFLEQKMPVKCAIYFKLADDVAKERLSHRRVCQNCQANYNLLLNSYLSEERCKKCGHILDTRDDDNQAAINRRIEAFHNQTEPLISFFQEKDKLISVDAQEKPEIIHEQLATKLKL